MLLRRAMIAEAMNAAVPDTNEPDLRARAADQEPIRRGQGIVGHFKCAAVNVDCNDLAVIADPHQGANLLIVNRRTPASMLLLAVMWLPDRHAFLLSP
jgi:hypothetical protein